MSVRETSALVKFIQANQPPINNTRSGDNGAGLVLVPSKVSPWRLRLIIAGILLAVGFIGGLWVSQTRAGRWALGSSAGDGASKLAAAPGEHPAPCPDRAEPMAAPALAAPGGPVAPAAASPPLSPTAPPAPAPQPGEIKHKKGAKQGTLSLRVKPACDIRIDGTDTGLMTPQKKLALDAGKHKIELVNKELGIRERLKVKIRAGKTTKVKRTLHGDAAD